MFSAIVTENPVSYNIGIPFIFLKTYLIDEFSKSYTISFNVSLKNIKKLEFIVTFANNN